MIKTPPRLRNTSILLRCSKKTHNDCRYMRNALMEKFPSVMSAYTTNSRAFGESWCVSACATLRDDEIESFEKKLKLFKHGKTRITKVAKMHISVDSR